MIPIITGRWQRSRRKTARALIASGRTKNAARKSAIMALLYVALIIIGHTAAMMYFEKFSIGDAFWLTLTSVTTVGYGDLSAATFAGRLSTILIVYVAGIFVVGKMAGDFFDYRSLRREAMKTGDWSWSKMQDHIVIIGSKVDSARHLTRLITECENNEATAGREIILLSKSYPDGLPKVLQDLNVRYAQGRGADPLSLEQCAIDKAEIVIVLSWDEENPTSDGQAFDVIHRVRELNDQAKLVVEVVDDSNRERLSQAGATLLIRPIRAYPEMIVGALINPGAGQILENLFASEGETISRLDEPLEGVWADIVVAKMRANAGTPIAYLDRTSGQIVTAPAGSKEVKGDALFLLGA